LNVTDEQVHDSKVLPKLVDDIAKSKNITVGKIIADGAYDSNAVFGCLVDSGILPCIKVRRNARVKKTNHILRNLSVISQKNDLQRWKDRA
jgi:hypothetical protein